MKSIKSFVVVGALSLLPFAGFAQTLTATASTLDSAEAQIAAQAKQAGGAYHITEAYSGNQVHMTADLAK